jgi:hypothetical protein
LVLCFATSMLGPFLYPIYYVQCCFCL